MFELRLFGPIEILEDGERLSGFRSQKTLALLAYLIVEERALALYGERQQGHLAVEARAGLGAAALALGDGETARQQVAAALERRDEGAPAGFPGVQEPVGVYLACIRVLRALNDGRAAAVLAAAHAELQRRAAILDDAGRRRYLQHPTHRALREAWEARRP